MSYRWRSVGLEKFEYVANDGKRTAVGRVFPLASEYCAQWRKENGEWAEMRMPTSGAAKTLVEGFFASGIVHHDRAAALRAAAS